MAWESASSTFPRPAFYTVILEIHCLSSTLMEHLTRVGLRQHWGFDAPSEDGGHVS